MNNINAFRQYKDKLILQISNLDLFKISKHGQQFTDVLRDDYNFQRYSYNIVYFDVRLHGYPDFDKIQQKYNINDIYKYIEQHNLDN